MADDLSFEATTPAANANKSTISRFTTQALSAEDVLKEQTVGLVHLSDFRKRRAEALDRVSRDGTPSTGGSSGGEGREFTPTNGSNGTVKKVKKRKVLKPGALSFGNDGDENETQDQATEPKSPNTEAAPTPSLKKRLKPNTTLSTPAIKAQTPSALRREAALKSQLQAEYTQQQSAVRATEFCLPFVFFDGKDAPGGVCRMKKGDAIWVFLDRARKVGVDRAGGGSGGGEAARRMGDWGRISVDDLMVVKGGLILPHHYDFHYFVLNVTKDYSGTTLLAHSSSPTAATPAHLLKPLSEDTESNSNPATPNNNGLTTASHRQLTAHQAAASRLPDSSLEGYADDPSLTKVVDRRWYERNKHIYPASTWEEFEAGKVYGEEGGGGRRDGLGNSYFFSR